MSSFTLNEQLATDTVAMGKCGFCQVRLHKNALYPWFILVPEVSVIELYELSPDDQAVLLDLINRLSRLIMKNFSVEKLNVATIGNIVKQMHIHVIGRQTGDACWPGTVWGHQASVPYTQDAIIEIQKKLMAGLGDGFKTTT
ncbi:MAG: HIT family protein [Gammaproteobacteria bacterium]